MQRGAVLCLLAAAGLFCADGASSGILDVNSCLDAKTEPWGCNPTKYVSGDHLQCTNDPNMGHMEWTGRPVYSSAFTLRTGRGAPGNDRRTYKPNKWLSVWLTVTDYRQKYRGLLLHAVDSNNTFVGQWNITSNGKDAMFRNPPTCLRSIMHSQAELKPLRVRFRFLAPPPGTGTISFRCLIKVGPANDGWFYWPNGNDPNLEGATPVGGGRGIGADLTLEEEPARRPSTVEWALGSAGQSCSDACALRSMKCDEDAMRSSATTTGPGLDAQISDVVSCPLPYKPTCSAVAPARSSDGTCWYNAANSDWMRTNVCPRVGGGATPQAMSSCGSRHSDASRFCACRRSGGARPQSLDDDAAWDAEVGLAEGAASSDDETQDRASSSEPGLAAMLKAFGQVGALLALFKLGGLKAMITGWLLLCAPVTSAHNWMRSPARAGFEASTQKPFRQRRSQDVHAQVGPGQKTAIKWATGHSRAHYFVVLSGQDEDKTRDSRYLRWVEDYIALAPAGANQAAQNPRFHSCRRDSDCVAASYYSGRVSSSDADFCEHPQYPDGTNLWRYRNNETVDDVFMFYESEKYPWIIGVLKYENNYNQPADEDIACLPVPARPGKGRHYIVHWVWRGYYDAVDVHTHPDPVPADLIYGNRTSGFVWTKIDHCQFKKPRRILSPILDATDDARACRDVIDSLGGLNTGSTSYQVDSPAINVVPYTNPPQVIHADAVNIPYGLDNPSAGIAFPSDYQTIALESMQLSGNESVHAVSTSAWLSRTTVTQNVRCSSVISTLTGVTWRYAVESCSAYWNSGGRKCTGIAWLSNGMPQSAVFSGTHTFQRCFSSGTTADSNYMLFAPTSAVTEPPSAGFVDPATWTDSNHDRYKVSFQPASSSTPLPAGWVADTGDLYGDRGNGMTYGWRCWPSGAGVRTNNGFINNPNMTGEWSGYANTQVWKNCPDGSFNEWNIAVPEGVYTVQFTTIGAGLVVENARRGTNDQGSAVQTVYVWDGNLTITAASFLTRDFSDPRMFFNKFNLYFVQIDKVRDAVPESWIPGTTAEAWWQLRLDEPNTPVGTVTIEMPGGYKFRSTKGPAPQSFAVDDCRQTWLLSGRDPQCYNNYLQIYSSTTGSRYFPADIVKEVDYNNKSVQYSGGYGGTFGRALKRYYSPNKLAGSFDNPRQGFVVSVSDQPCTDAGGCPTGASEQICEVVTRWSYCLYRQLQNGPCPYVINCNGAAGRYVRVRLRRDASQKKLWPVATRIRASPQKLPLQARPASDMKRRLVCYALDPKLPQTTDPEFVVSEDPDDPVFYSTCYKRIPKVTWLPIDSDVDAESRWSFNGQCLSCDSFSANEQEYNMSRMTTPQWDVDATCVDCVNARASFAAVTESSSSDRAGVSQGAFTATVTIGVVLITGLSAVVGVLLWRRITGKTGATARSKPLRKSSRPARARKSERKSRAVERQGLTRAPRRPTGRLPKGWSAHVDEESGFPYYFNTSTGESLWDIPPMDDTAVAV